jgi:hypothetical protein
MLAGVGFRGGELARSVIGHVAPGEAVEGFAQSSLALNFEFGIGN